MPAGDIYQLSVDQTLFGVALTNTFHWEQLDADTDADMGVGVINGYINNVLPTQLAAQSGDLTVNQIRAIRVAPIPTQQSLVVVNQVGDRPNFATAANIAGLISEYTLPASRTRVAKTFLAGLLASDVTDGILDAAARILLETFADVLLALLLTPGGTSFQRVAYETATATGRKVLLREVRQATRKLRSRTKTT